MPTRTTPTPTPAPKTTSPATPKPAPSSWSKDAQVAYLRAVTTEGKPFSDLEEHWEAGRLTRDGLRHKNAKGETPVFTACETGDLDLLEWLCGHGEAAQDLQTPDNAGQTPLFVACRDGDETVAEWLVEHGAARSFDVTTEEGETPLSFAMANGNERMAAWIRRAIESRDLQLYTL